MLAGHGAIEALLKALSLFLAASPTDPQQVSEALRTLHYICLLNGICTTRLVTANGFELVCKSELHGGMAHRFLGKSTAVCMSFADLPASFAGLIYNKGTPW